MADTVVSSVASLQTTVAARGDRRRIALLSGGTTLVLLVVWELVARNSFDPATLAPPTTILRTIADDPDFFRPHIWATVWPAFKGWLVGNLLAVLAGVAVVLVPRIEQAVLQLAILTYAVPTLAIGPILVVTFDGDAPKSILAGLAVFFTTVVGTVLGLRSADRTSLDLIRAYGGGRWTIMRKARVPAALPSFMNALKISAPAAILGSILGDFFGSDKGLGTALVSSAFGNNGGLKWAVAVVMTALGGVGYLLIGVLGRAVTPWSAEGKH
jgi:ABC-type nitrate/sulfonate/bicarbonate transport system permease component